MNLKYNHLKTISKISQIVHTILIIILFEQIITSYHQFFIKQINKIYNLNKLNYRVSLLAFIMRRPIMHSYTFENAKYPTHCDTVSRRNTCLEGTRHLIQSEYRTARKESRRGCNQKSIRQLGVSKYDRHGSPTSCDYFSNEHSMEIL